eukprot:gene1669-1858_t
MASSSDIDIEQFFFDLPSQLRQAKTQLFNSNVNAIEFWARRCEGYVNFLSIFLRRCQEISCPFDLQGYLEELLTNVSLLLIQLDEVILDNNNSFNANECPNEDSGYATESGEKFGRPRKLVSKDELLRLFNIHQSWHIVAAEIGVSVKTIYRRRQELGMQISDANGPRTTYTSISQTDLCEAIRDVLRVLPNAGESYVIGACRSRGIFVQRSRIRDAINTIDPVSRALRRTVSIVRRHYSVPGPNSLWYVFLIISIPSS